MLALLLSACLVNSELYDERKAALTDNDGDGYSEEQGDCDDREATIFPDAVEICDQVDNDCDGLMDDEDDSLSDVAGFRDADGDGWGSDEAVLGCVLGEGVAEQSGDCDDTNPDISPAAAEVCGDGVDNDCDSDPADGCRAEGTLALASSQNRLLGSSRYDNVGEWLLPAGDLNGDGRQDVAISSRGGNEDSVFIVDSLSNTNSVSSVGAIATRTITWAETERVGFGEDLTLVFRTSFVGDPMLIVGTHYFPAYGYYTNATGLDLDPPPDLILEWPTGEGSTSTDNRTASLGDQDGDGIDEIAVAATSVDGTSGIAMLNGNSLAGGTINVPDEAFGRLTVTGSWGARILESAGDIDGDGPQELCVSAPMWREGSIAGGATFLVSPNEITGLGALEDAGARITAEVGGDFLGLGACQSAGDVNNDGYDDVLIGAPLATRDGALVGLAYIVHGPVTTNRSAADAHVRFAGQTAGDAFGIAMPGSGDLDGDGNLDVALGAAQPSGDGPGQVHLFYGPLAGSYDASDSDALFVGQAVGDGATLPLILGDTNDDGLDDLLIGAPGNDAGGPDAGAIYVIFGSGI